MVNELATIVFHSNRPRQLLINYLPHKITRVLSKKYYTRKPDIIKLKDCIEVWNFKYNSSSIKYFTYLLVKYFYIPGAAERRLTDEFYPQPPEKLKLKYIKHIKDQHKAYRVPFGTNFGKKIFNHQCCAKTKRGARCKKMTVTLFCQIHQKHKNVKCYWT
tara:strand:- start:6868 stop:7347 length:480 start_codon:yes stop_codon:yes gene_type:complete